jgi:hypothetical protein
VQDSAPAAGLWMNFGVWVDIEHRTPVLVAACLGFAPCLQDPYMQECSSDA